MSTAPEGRIDVVLVRRGGRVASVDIRSSRPQLARRFMAGRTPGEAAELAGLIFSLCGQAQRTAVQAACLAARGGGDAPWDPTPVRMELAREHAWRLLLDWPREAGLAPDMNNLLTLRQVPPDQFATALETLLRETLLGEPPSVWLARDAAGLQDWCRHGGSQTARLFARFGEVPDTGISTAPPLPSLAGWDERMATTLARRAMDEGDFCARPDWQGETAETGALTRVWHQPPMAAWLSRHGRGLGARLLARLVELALLPRQLSQDSDSPTIRAWSPWQGTGMAGVETSRGLLFQVVRLKGGRVEDYRILAPTEWNFHPSGPLAQALQSLPPGPNLESRARLVTRSLDPCVDFGVEWRDA